MVQILGTLRMQPVVAALLLHSLVCTSGARQYLKAIVEDTQRRDDAAASESAVLQDAAGWRQGGAATHTVLAATELAAEAAEAAQHAQVSARVARSTDEILTFAVAATSRDTSASAAHLKLPKGGRLLARTELEATAADDAQHVQTLGQRAQHVQTLGQRSMSTSRVSGSPSGSLVTETARMTQQSPELSQIHRTTRRSKLGVGGSVRSDWLASIRGAKRDAPALAVSSEHALATSRQLSALFMQDVWVDDNVQAVLIRVLTLAGIMLVGFASGMCLCVHIKEALVSRRSSSLGDPPLPSHSSSRLSPLTQGAEASMTITPSQAMMSVTTDFAVSWSTTEFQRQSGDMAESVRRLERSAEEVSSEADVCEEQPRLSS